jgi:hypothetical protein
MVAGGAAGGAAASAAAAAKKRREQEEEEQMTTYSTEDLNEEWEFKIVRSAFEAFGNPRKFKQMLKEEAEAGWVLVEKFDNGRVRLKRPASARKQDHLLPPEINPYRTSYGMPEMTMVLVIVGLVGLLAFGTILVVVLAS